MTEQAVPVSRLRAAATMLRIAWDADPKRSGLVFGLLTVRRIADTLFALWLKLLLDGVQAADTSKVTLAAAGLVTSIVGSAALAYAGDRVQRRLTERAHHLVERRLLELVGRTPTLEIHETPEYLTQLEVLEDEGWEFGQVVPSLIELFTTSVRIITTALLLFNLHPLLLLLPLFGLPALCSILAMNAPPNLPAAQITCLSLPQRLGQPRRSGCSGLVQNCLTASMLRTRRSSAFTGALTSKAN